ncbi:hypothetical protein B0I35DRAFT_408260 [Stachybotrys elegans]|uniref:Uncharacterized protein n=1 Tax=Stachybotrys elegans TaxID=80388 RepID=A0A8K0WSC1_9HYPO|nr:hypothetical protein B0I35DRAFT_408260 [Stachybotrys elegans]
MVSLCLLGGDRSLLRTVIGKQLQPTLSVIPHHLAIRSLKGAIYRDLMGMELSRWAASYESLGSDGFDEYAETRATKFRARTDDGQESAWSNTFPSPDPTTTASTTPECPAKEHKHKDRGVSEANPHGNAEDISPDLPRFPFSLVSLPEAAFTQHHRRACGEEDHTDSAGLFAARRGTRTASTTSSFGRPTTSHSIHRHCHHESDSSGYPRRNTHESYESKVPIVDNRCSTRRPSSSILLGILPAIKADSPSVIQDSVQAPSRLGVPHLLNPKLLRLRSTPSSARNKRDNKFLPQEGSRPLFTPSENNLIELAREDILFRRRYSDGENRRQRAIVFAIRSLTIFFPLIGVLALCGKFDTTVSWYTHGELCGLNLRQRFLLKRQILAEAIIYPVLIIVLAVYYSVHG